MVAGDALLRPLFDQGTFIAVVLKQVAQDDSFLFLAIGIGQGDCIILFLVERGVEPRDQPILIEPSEGRDRIDLIEKA
jgi:hypothetical protein